MNFTQKELKVIAMQRAEKNHRKVLIISLLLAINLLGLILLGLYINGDYPPQPTESIYTSGNNTIEIVGSTVTLNGQESQLQITTTHKTPIRLIAYPPITILIIGWIYYIMQAKKEANKLMYEWARKGKDDRQ